MNLLYHHIIDLIMKVGTAYAFPTLRSSLKPFEIYGQLIGDFTSNETIANNQKFNSDFLASYTKHTGTVEDAIRKAKENVKL